MTRRILHVVGGMDRGGIQGWLMDLLRSVDRQRYHMDFLVQSNAESAHDREIVELGSKLLYCPSISNPWNFGGRFARVLEQQQAYDIVHSHIYAVTGLVLRFAARLGVPLGIAHAHADRRTLEVASGLTRQLQLRLMKAWIRKYAGVKLAVSRNAAEDLFGPAWRQDPSVRVVHCGLDLAPYRVVRDRGEMRARLLLPADALVIGHVGRFDPEKNHAFLVEVAAEAIKLNERVHLLLVGDGALRRDTERRAAALGVAGQVHFAGARDDVPAILRAAVDLFVFPSVSEGLGLAAIEAQAAGLPCLISDRVPTEADVVPSLISRRSPDEAAALWARQLMEMSTQTRVDPATALLEVERSSFNITQSVRHVTRIYDGDF